MSVSRRTRIVAWLVALGVAIGAAHVPAGPASDDHAMPCCAASAHCTMPAFTEPCCAASPGPATPATPSPVLLKPGHVQGPGTALDASLAASASGGAVSFAFELRRLRLPHDPTYLKNASFRI
jgi:hypothetical protein